MCFNLCLPRLNARSEINVTMLENFMIHRVTNNKITIILSLAPFSHPYSYKTSLSSSLSSPSSSGASSRRPKSGQNSKMLKDESNGLSFSNNNNNNKDDIQLISHSSSAYWPANENVKRSQQQQTLESGSSNNIFNNIDESEFKDYPLGGLPPSSYDNSIVGSNDDEVIYDDDYDANGFFNSVNQDNINDFYYYINHLLSKKPNQKSI
jgi:hypothetical protein